MKVATLILAAFTVGPGPVSGGAESFPTLAVPAGAGTFMEALGREAGVWGRPEGGGLESWVYPFKAFDGLTLHIGGEDGVEEGATAVGSDGASHIAGPAGERLTIPTAHGPVELSITVPRRGRGGQVAVDLPAGWPGGEREDAPVRLRFRPVLAPMFLSPGAPLEARVEGAAEAVFREPSRGVELAIHAPGAAGITASGEDGSWEVAFPAAGGGPRRSVVTFAMGWPGSGGPGAREVARNIAGGTAAAAADWEEHYAGVLGRAPRVRTPEPGVDRALAWGAIALDRLRVENPDLGPGLVSGYSPSGRGTRPRYCWFFEEPTLTAWAYHRLGLGHQVAEAYDFLFRYQRADGKTVHEVSQSLRYQPDYFSTYRYAYLHSDGPVYYLAGCAQHYAETGDADSVKRSWPALRKAAEWCFSAVDPEDGLIGAEPGDWGVAESSTGVWKDTQTEAMWLLALRGLVRFGRVAGDAEMAARAEALAPRVARSIEEKLWDAESGRYLWGLDRAGRPLRSEIPHHAIGFWLGSFREERVRQVLERFSSSEFSTDWGVRSLAITDPAYDPANYQSGSVWPVWNAGVIAANYRYGRPVEAYRLWRAMLRLHRGDGPAGGVGALGPMPEVLDGRRYRLLPEGVPHQMFSELARTSGFYHGLLGMVVDVPAGRLRVAPQPPLHWRTLQVENIPFGGRRVALDLLHRPGVWELEVDNGSPPEFGPELELEVVAHLPAGAVPLAVAVDGAPAPENQFSTSTRATASGTAVTFRRAAHPGVNRFTVAYRGGVAFLPLDREPVPGKASANLRVIRAGLDPMAGAGVDPGAPGCVWAMEVEGIPGRAYAIDFFTGYGIRPAQLRPAPAKNVGEVGVDNRVATPGGFRQYTSAPADAPLTAAGFARWRVVIPFSDGG